MSANFQTENFQVGRDAGRDVTGSAVARSAYEDPSTYLTATSAFRGGDEASKYFGNLTLTSENENQGAASPDETEYAPRKFVSYPPAVSNDCESAPAAPADGFDAPMPTGDVVSVPGGPAPEALREFMNYFRSTLDTQDQGAAPPDLNSYFKDMLGTEAPESGPPASTFEFETVPDAQAPESPPPAVSGDSVVQPDAPGSQNVEGQDNPNQDPVVRSAENLVGTPVTDLEHGINPRLGCARMVSHALHEADPTFPETNNSKQLDQLLLEHGYEAVTVKPGDPALSQSQPGDILIGQRPDGMPSHAAISMGDGKVFNNNSDSGQGQMDSLSQFDQGMHDAAGNWNKNGFAEVTVYRKKSD